MMEAGDIVSRFQRLKSQKQNFDVVYQEIGDFCHPNSADFNRLYSPGEKRNRELYDQTAQMAIDLSSSSLIGLVANPASRWFHIEMTDEDLNRDSEVMQWCEKAGQVALNHFNAPESNFYGALKSALVQTLAYGMPAIHFQERSDGTFDFKDIPLHQLVVAEGADGMVDTCIREFKMTARQIMQKVERDEWSAHKDLVTLVENNPDEEVEVLYMVAPREGGREDAIDRKNLPIAGYYVDKKHKHIMLETGYYENPMPVARWFKTAGEVYGRSPAMIALSDVKTLNVAMRMLMFGIEKKLQPAVFLPDDGVMNKVDLSAGGVTYFDREKGGPVFYDGNTDVNAGFALVQELQNSVRKAFYVDQLQLSASANMTATEVLQRQDEKARLLAPSIGRIQTELLGPIVQRGVSMLVRNGRIAVPPEKMQGQDFKVNYVSPIQRAQRSIDAQNINNTVLAIGQLAQIDPSVLAVVDIEAAAEELMDINGVTGILKRSDDEIEEIKQRQQEEQAQQLTAAMAGQMGGMQ